MWMPVGMLFSDTQSVLIAMIPCQSLCIDPSRPGQLSSQTVVIDRAEKNVNYTGIYANYTEITRKVIMT